MSRGRCKPQLILALFEGNWCHSLIMLHLSLWSEMLCLTLMIVVEPLNGSLFGYYYLSLLSCELATFCSYFGWCTRLGGWWWRWGWGGCVSSIGLGGQWG
jgi:hypothetical protein